MDLDLAAIAVPTSTPEVRNLEQILYWGFCSVGCAWEIVHVATQNIGLPLLSQGKVAFGINRVAHYFYTSPSRSGAAGFWEFRRVLLPGSKHKTATFLGNDRYNGPERIWAHFACAREFWVHRLRTTKIINRITTIVPTKP